jgi:hypothetical protein
MARSNIALLNTMGARVRIVAPRTLLPAEIERLGVEVFHEMAQGLDDVDIVMMLWLQSERMHGSFVPSTREYFRFFGLDYDKLRAAKPDALIIHPGPMNRGVEIGSEVACASREFWSSRGPLWIASQPPPVILSSGARATRPPRPRSARTRRARWASLTRHSIVYGLDTLPNYPADLRIVAYRPPSCVPKKLELMRGQFLEFLGRKAFHRL